MDLQITFPRAPSLRVVGTWRAREPDGTAPLDDLTGTVTLTETQKVQGKIVPCGYLLLIPRDALVLDAGTAATLWTPRRRGALPGYWGILGRGEERENDG